MSSTYKLHVEGLESRALLAGDVMADAAVTSSIDGAVSYDETEVASDVTVAANADTSVSAVDVSADADADLSIALASLTDPVADDLDGAVDHALDDAEGVLDNEADTADEVADDLTDVIDGITPDLPVSSLLDDLGSVADVSDMMDKLNLNDLSDDLKVSNLGNGINGLVHSSGANLKGFLHSLPGKLHLDPDQLPADAVQPGDPVTKTATHAVDQVFHMIGRGRGLL